MKTFSILLSILFSAALLNPLAAQNTITIDATGEVVVPADIVKFQIIIRVTGEDANQLYEEHKKQERYLAGVIREYGLSENLSFQPMSINARQTREGREIQSHQVVHLTIDDFSLLEKLQVGLIENGFENFNARFSSTELESGQDKALDLAIDNARKQAERIAANIGKELGGVQSIEHTAAKIVRGQEDAAVMLRGASHSLIEEDQTVPVSSSVRVIYLIE